MGNALPSPPQASALTSQEALYISMLAEKGIYPISTYDDLAFGGHVIAYDLRNGVCLQ